MKGKAIVYSKILMQNKEISIALKNLNCWNCKNKIDFNSAAFIYSTHIKNGATLTLKDLTFFICSDCERFKDENQVYISSFECEA